MKMNNKQKNITALMICVGATLLGGCAWEVSSAPKHATVQPTVGQQLVDLQKAKEAGAITESEYQAQKAKLLGR